MNLNDYKDTNGNVEVSETLVSDLIGGINTNESGVSVNTSAIATLSSAVQDTGWIDFALLNGNVANGGIAQECAYRKIGKVVYVRLHLLRVNYNTIVANMPLGFRPADATVNIIALDRVSNEVSRGYITSSGVVSCGGFTQQAGTIICQTVSYPVD